MRKTAYVTVFSVVAAVVVATIVSGTNTSLRSRLVRELPETVPGPILAAKLGFDAITRKDQDDPDSIQHLMLRLPLRAKDRSRIEPADVIVRVLVYDIVDGRQVEITKANIGKKWEATRPDWSSRDVETLDVIYARSYPKLGDRIEQREYYGYVASIYYKNVLQDVSSNPPDLIQRARVPRTLPLSDTSYDNRSAK